MAVGAAEVADEDENMCPALKMAVVGERLVAGEDCGRVECTLDRLYPGRMMVGTGGEAALLPSESRRGRGGETRMAPSTDERDREREWRLGFVVVAVPIWLPRS